MVWPPLLNITNFLCQSLSLAACSQTLRTSKQLGHTNHLLIKRGSSYIGREGKLFTGYELFGREHVYTQGQSSESASYHGMEEEQFVLGQLDAEDGKRIKKPARLRQNLEAILYDLKALGQTPGFISEENEKIYDPDIYGNLWKQVREGREMHLPVVEDIQAKIYRDAYMEDIDMMKKAIRSDFGRRCSGTWQSDYITTEDAEVLAPNAIQSLENLRRRYKELVIESARLKIKLDRRQS